MKLTASQALEEIFKCRNYNGTWDGEKLDETIGRLEKELNATKDLRVVSYACKVRDGWGSKERDGHRSALCPDGQVLIGIAKNYTSWKCIHLKTGLICAVGIGNGYTRKKALEVARVILKHVSRKGLESSDGGEAAKAFSKSLVAWIKNPEGEFKPEVKHAGKETVEKAR